MAKGSGTKDRSVAAQDAARHVRVHDVDRRRRDPPAIVCQVGGTQLKYQKRAIDDLHAMLKEHGGWMDLGGADEQKPAADGTVEAWGRSETTRSAAGTA